MNKVKQFFTKRRVLNEKKQNDSAQEAMLEEAYNDLYRKRGRVYKVNFFRGIFFGAGSALGGTVVIALIVWMLSWFVNFPLIGQYFEGIKDSLDQTSQETRDRIEN